MVIQGYRIKSTDICVIKAEIGKLYDAYQKIITKEYGKLLGEEIAFIADQIALNIFQRNPQISIYEQAIQNLNSQIQMAKLNGANSKYNFQVIIHVMPDTAYTYLDVICPNMNLFRIFKKLEEYSLTEEEYQDAENKKTITWNHLIKEATKIPPVSANFFFIPEVDKNSIKYPEKKERCETAARHNVTNRLLHQISGGQQIQPAFLMRFFDQAMEQLLLPETKKEIRQKTAELMGILSDMTDEFVYSKDEINMITKENSEK